MSDPTFQEVVDQVLPLWKDAQRRAHEATVYWSDPENMKPWWSAIQHSVLDEVNALLKKGCPIDSVSYNGKTALSFAVSQHNMVLTRLLISKGANPNGPCDLFGSPLGAALLVEDEILVQYLLDRGASPNSKSQDEPALCCAVRTRPGMARLLVQAGADVECVGREGETPLLIALSTHLQPDNVHLLLEHHADVNRSNQQGETPLMKAARLMYSPGVKKIIEALLERGANVNVAHPETGHTPLMIAVSSQLALQNPGKFYKVRQLLDAGANPNAQCPEGSVLDIARRTGPSSVIELVSMFAAKDLANQTRPTKNSTSRSRRL